MTAATALLAALSGSLIGLILGLVGGGGSILAVPLLISVVGVGSTHAAIGTGAIAVALNAAIGLAAHWRAGTIRWGCASVFAAAGVVGAALGAELGKAVPGERLLGLFGLLMAVVGLAMLRPRPAVAEGAARLTRGTAGRLLPRLAGFGLGAGLLAGFFGIGGGFLVVPGLVAATGMATRNAIGSSLVAVTAFGATTAASYALDGLVLWPVAGLMLAGGIGGAALGVGLGGRLVLIRGALEGVFAVMVLLTGLRLAWGWLAG